ncbi:hypothetical protein EGW08_018022 [Elysia chlorotica]|uniref:Uncharacterized protein n=1 Tax=Elysia chlorotica TaxID=188477 RepID=A0A3S1AWR6_ELYCH|nr:hypothetical protein EGW08_018022 [Elysia chlorotica]
MPVRHSSILSRTLPVPLLVPVGLLRCCPLSRPLSKYPPKKCPCKCKLNNGKPCIDRFSAEDLEDLRCQSLALTSAQLDLVVLAKLECGMHTSNLTQCSRFSKQTERKTQRTDFFHSGHKICRDVFKYVHGLSQD